MMMMMTLMPLMTTSVAASLHHQGCVTAHRNCIFKQKEAMTPMMMIVMKGFYKKGKI